ncbi:MAG TPA: thiamine-phosphate kinase [Actinomycetales bacterium]|nr:thiamine-phosphate kinase [Actinomycetales bacterium]
MARPRTLGDVGESGLLREIFPLLPRGGHTLLGPGDDAAVLAAPDGRVVVTTDVLVEGRDFRREWSSAADVGAKAAAQNLADVAAMGAVPTGLVVSLVAPPDTDVEWALGVTRGLAEACEGTGVGVVGGDLSSGSELVVAVTAFGDLQGREPVRRDGAGPGDVVAVAGVLGWSSAGWELLRTQRTEVAPDLVAAHRRPDPPLAAGPAAASAGATAMIDVSDGLLRDLGRIAVASGVRIDLSRDLLTADVDAVSAAAEALGADPWQWVLGGGEDHGLAACFGPDILLPNGFRRIGTVRDSGVGEPRVLLDGEAPPSAPGWDHFGG